LASEHYHETVHNSKTRKFARMSISHNGVTENVVFELFNDIAPKTCHNFIALCQGFKRKSDGEQIGYEGSEIHRIVPGMYI